MKLMLNGKEVSGMGHYVMAGDIKDATAEDSNVLSGKAFYNNNGKREGTMPNRGGMSAELAAGGSVSIPEGYHNGEGVVRAQDLASQTQGDAGAGNIDSGKTAWVNGVQVTGTSTKVDTSGATATAGDIASGKTAWVNGAQVTGTMSAEKWTKVSGSSWHESSGGSWFTCWDYDGGNDSEEFVEITGPDGAIVRLPLGPVMAGYSHTIRMFRSNDPWGSLTEITITESSNNGLRVSGSNVCSYFSVRLVTRG